MSSVTLASFKAMMAERARDSHEDGCTYSSLAVEELRDMALGERSKSESDRYRKDSRRWLWGKLAWRTSPEPEPGLVWASRGLRPTESPFSTSKLQRDSMGKETLGRGELHTTD